MYYIQTITVLSLLFLLSAFRKLMRILCLCVFVFACLCARVSVAVSALFVLSSKNKTLYFVPTFVLNEIQAKLPSIKLY